MSENASETPSPAPNVPPIPPQPHPITPPPHPSTGYRTQPPPPRSSGCGKAIVIGLVSFFALGIVGICVLIGSVVLFAVATGAFDEIASEQQEKTVTEKFISGNRTADEKIAVITIDGMITGSADGFVAKQIRRVISDDKVKAVVLRVNSPGGTMTGSDYYYYLLKKMK